MATISNTPRPGYVWDSTDNVWYPIGVGNHNHSEIQKTIVDAKGDLIVGTANDTVARQAVGTDGQALIADSTQTNGIKWGSALPDQTSQSGNYLTTNGTSASWAAVPTGGMTLIQETAASANSSLSFGSISGSYKQLLLVWSGIYHSATGSEFGIRFNSDSGSGYNCQWMDGYGTTIGVNRGANNGIYGGVGVPFGVSADQGNSDFAKSTIGYLLIDNYASTSKYKKFETSFAYWDNNNVRTNFGWIHGIYGSTSAITSVDIYRKNGTGTFSNSTSTSIRLYGVS